MMSAERAENIAEATQVAAEFEGEIRDIIRSRDVTFLRTPAAKPGGDVNNLNSLIQRVAGNSTVEIDNLIDQLQDMREFLQIEGERISREIAGYAQASQNARSQMEMIAEQIVQLRAGLQSVRAGIN
jgi:hypothetical protein